MIIPIEVYRSCVELPLYNFIKIVVNNDLKYLYKKNKLFYHKSPDLIAVWDLIFDEYSRLSDNTQNSHILELLKEIRTIELKISLINTIVSLLRSVAKNGSNIVDYEPSINLLKQYGFYFEYLNVTLLDDCDKVLNQSKTLQIELNDLQSDYNSLTSANNSAATEKDFIDEVALISSHHKIQINTKQISVMEYISYLSLFKKANA